MATKKLGSGPDDMMGQLLQLVAALLEQGVTADDIRATVDAVPGMDPEARDDNAPDSNAGGDNGTPQQSAATYRVLDRVTGSLFLVRLDARELGVCKHNNIPPSRYAQGKLHVHRDSPRRGQLGIRVLEGGGGQ